MHSHDRDKVLHLIWVIVMGGKGVRSSSLEMNVPKTKHFLFILFPYLLHFNFMLSNALVNVSGIFAPH